MKELLEAGIHFGHQTNRWNPRMEPFLFGERNGIHIIDLQQTVPLIHDALGILKDIAANGGRILFVGTKRQAQKIISESANDCGQYFMNHRWLGGTLTNWTTISKSIDRLKSYEELLLKEDSGLTKKEIVGIQRQKNKLEASLGGIKDMSRVPDAIFVIDTNREHIAIKEANVLNIPVIAIVDSNSNPAGVDYPIPGNDDATRAISLYCKLASEAILEGLQDTFKSSSIDAGTSKENLIEENIDVKTKAKNDNNTLNPIEQKKSEDSKSKSKNISPNENLIVKKDVEESRDLKDKDNKKDIKREDEKIVLEQNKKVKNTKLKNDTDISVEKKSELINTEIKTKEENKESKE